MRALRRSSYFILLFATLFFFLVNATLAIEGVKQGLLLCFETVFPALFPFLVLSELILSSGIGTMLGKLLSPILGALFGISQAGSGALVLGTLCGQPIASCAAVSLYEKNEITKKEAQRLSLFANNPGSGFVIAAVGGMLFQNNAAGVALFVITLISSAVLGILLHLFSKEDEQLTPKGCSKEVSPPFCTLFTSAVQHSLSALLQVGAFLLFFSALTTTLKDAIAHVLPTGIGRPLFFGILELTTGIRSAVAELPPYTAFRISAFLCSFGGICVCMQILSLTQKLEISLWKYLLAKLIQGGIALLLCEGYLRLVAPTLTPSASVQTINFTTHFSMLAVVLSVLLAGLLWQSYKTKKARRF